MGWKRIILLQDSCTWKHQSAVEFVYNVVKVAIVNSHGAVDLVTDNIASSKPIDSHTAEIAGGQVDTKAWHWGHSSQCPGQTERLGGM